MIDKLMQELQYLKDSKQLLDDILSYYSIYEMEFKFQSEADFKKMLKRINPDTHWQIKSDREILNEKIRKYLEFDDSE